MIPQHVAGKCLALAMSVYDNFPVVSNITCFVLVKPVWMEVKYLEEKVHQGT